MVEAKTGGGEPSPSVELDEARFQALFQRLNTWNRWGSGDRRGALNYLTPDRVAAAGSEVRAGISVTMSHPLELTPAADNRDPPTHRMTRVPQAEAGGGDLRFAMDYVGMNTHGDASSHLDALCHVVYQGALWNGIPSNTITASGAADLGIDEAHNGIVGRGVLLDLPRLYGRSWLEPGEHVFARDLRAAEEAQGVGVRSGDILFVRVGHRRRRNELGAWDVADTRAGLHPTAMEFIAEREVAALGSDSNNDAAPSSTAGVAFPIHVLAVNAMGLYLFDFLQLEDLTRQCIALGRWSFLCVAAPLRLPDATGSPVNPIAIF